MTELKSVKCRIKARETITYTTDTDLLDGMDLEDQAIDFMTNCFEDWHTGKVEISIEVEVTNDLHR